MNQRLGSHPGYQGVSVERGISGAAPGDNPAFIALCHYAFQSLEAFMEAFGPHAARLQGDMANSTDIEPVIQVSEVCRCQTRP